MTQHQPTRLPCIANRAVYLIKTLPGLLWILVLSLRPVQWVITFLIGATAGGTVMVAGGLWFLYRRLFPKQAPDGAAGTKLSARAARRLRRANTRGARGGGAAGPNGPPSAGGPGLPPLSVMPTGPYLYRRAQDVERTGSVQDGNDRLAIEYDHVALAGGHMEGWLWVMLRSDYSGVIMKEWPPASKGKSGTESFVLYSCTLLCHTCADPFM